MPSENIMKGINMKFLRKFEFFSKQHVWKHLSKKYVYKNSVECLVCLVNPVLPLNSWSVVLARRRIFRSVPHFPHPPQISLLGHGSVVRLQGWKSDQDTFNAAPGHLSMIEQEKREGEKFDGSFLYQGKMVFELPGKIIRNFILSKNCRI